LKALLENEINERKRTTILLNMLQDHNQRLTALSEASINAAATSAKMSATGSSATTTSQGGGGGSLTAVSTEYTLLQYVSYIGLLMAVIGCLWAILSSSSSAGSNSRGQPSRYRKDTSHIV
jgi:hypothetical protein